MKKLLKAASLCAAALLMVGCFASCTAEEEPGSNAGNSNTGSEPAAANYDLVSDGKLIMGTNAQFPPFEFYENQTIVGVDAEIMGEIAKRLGLELEIKDMEFDSLPASIKAKEIDVIGAGYTADPDREENMDFTDSYYTANQTIIVRADSTAASADDLKGKIIGGQSGTTGLITCAVELTDEANIKAYTNGALAVEDLLNGKLDAVIIDNNPANEYKNIHNIRGEKIKLLENQFDEEHYVFGVQKGNKALADAINSTLAEMKEDGSFQTIIDKYIK